MTTNQHWKDSATVTHTMRVGHCWDNVKVMHDAFFRTRLAKTLKPEDHKAVTADSYRISHRENFQAVNVKRFMLHLHTQKDWQ